MSHIRTIFSKLVFRDDMVSQNLTSLNSICRLSDQNRYDVMKPASTNRIISGSIEASTAENAMETIIFVYKSILSGQRRIISVRYSKA